VSDSPDANAEDSAAGGVEGDFFDPSFIAELEALASAHAGPKSALAISAALHERLSNFLRRDPVRRVTDGGGALSENEFVALPNAALAERSNELLESCRQAGSTEAVRAVESFIVFFQALVPTLAPESSREVKATFFRLVPSLVLMAFEEVDDTAGRRESHGSLALLETILLEVSSVRLAPVESGMLFKSLDQLATLIAAGEHALARDVVALPLLAILRKNRVARALFRLMEVEVALQGYLKERFGYSTPRIRVPDDVAALADFGPLRVFDEEGPDGMRRSYLQVQLPDIPILSDIVVHLSAEDGSGSHKLRLDGLGSVPLDLPPGLYGIGLLYEPEPSPG
jgi:hypothetical protein